MTKMDLTESIGLEMWRIPLVSKITANRCLKLREDKPAVCPSCRTRDRQSLGFLGQRLPQSSDPLCLGSPRFPLCVRRGFRWGSSGSLVRLSLVRESVHQLVPKRAHRLSFVSDARGKVWPSVMLKADPVAIDSDRPGCSFARVHNVRKALGFRLWAVERGDLSPKS